VYFDEDTNQVQHHFPGSRSMFLEEEPLDETALECLMDLQEALQEWLDYLPMRTEYHRKGQIFRAHPNFRGLGPWRDWVLIDWGQDGKLPGEIWVCVDLRELPDNVKIDFGGVCIQRGIFAMIESSTCIEGAEDAGASDMFIPLQKEVESIDAKGICHQEKVLLCRC
jgi:hypothetical protein